MKKLIALFAVALVAVSAYAAQIETCVAVPPETLGLTNFLNSVLIRTTNYVRFTATGTTLAGYTDNGDVALILLTVTNATTYALTNNACGSYKGYAKFLGTTEIRRDNYLVKNASYTLLLQSSGTLTSNTVKLLIY